MQEVSQAQGRTVLFVSHNMGSIKSLCKRSLLMENGRIIFDGETGECINKYLNKSRQEIGTRLSLIKIRNGNGKLRFTDYRILDELNNNLTECTSGNHIKIQIKFRKHLGKSETLLWNPHDYK